MVEGSRENSGDSNAILKMLQFSSKNSRKFSHVILRANLLIAVLASMVIGALPRLIAEESPADSVKPIVLPNPFKGIVTTKYQMLATTKNALKEIDPAPHRVCLDGLLNVKGRRFIHSSHKTKSFPAGSFSENCFKASERSAMRVDSLPRIEQLSACKNEEDIYRCLPYNASPLEFIDMEFAKIKENRSRLIAQRGEVDLRIEVKSQSRWLLYEEIDENEIRFLALYVEFLDAGSVVHEIESMVIREGILTQREIDSPDDATQRVDKFPKR